MFLSIPWPDIVWSQVWTLSKAGQASRGTLHLCRQRIAELCRPRDMIETLWCVQYALQCQFETHVGVAVRFKYVQNFLDICEVMNASGHSSRSSKCHSSLQGWSGRCPIRCCAVSRFTITTLSAVLCSTGDILVTESWRLDSVSDLNKLQETWWSCFLILWNAAAWSGGKFYKWASCLC